MTQTSSGTIAILQKFHHFLEQNKYSFSVFFLLEAYVSEHNSCFGRRVIWKNM